MTETNKRRIQNRLSELILKSAFKVHQSLGPGLLDSAYGQCLFHELRKLGLSVDRHKELPLKYQEMNLDIKYRIDMIVENKIVLLMKSVDHLTELHSAELQTHLLVSNCEMGFLLNFNVATLKNGVRRIINKSDSTCNLAVS